MKKSSFGRIRDQRNLLLRNLATSVILYESVVTTEAKGRTVQPIVERLIRIAQKKDQLTARRELMAYIFDQNAVKKLLEEVAPRYNDRTSGFTRRFRLPARAGDGAPQVMVQLTKSVRLEAAAEAKPAKKSDADKTETVETVTDEGKTNE